MDSDEHILQEAMLSRIRNVVNQNKIKLWLEPYYDKETLTPNESNMIQTANSLALELEMDDMEVLRGLKKLQDNALEKLRARDALQSRGEIELKVKLDKTTKTKMPEMDAVITVSTDATSSGQDLAKVIGSKLQLEADSFKMVTAGTVIKSDQSLNEQQIKPGQVVMILTIDKGSKALQIVSEQKRILSTAREDAEILGRNDQMTITDQSGKLVELPSQERKALIIAMSLHEKGKTAMKKMNFELAIVLLLDAMDEYKQCRSEILGAVDNYGLLNLDIAWCYLRLGNLNNLPNAQERLRECEASFKKSYGENLERVMALKGHSSNEAVLYVRLHLLQAICAFIGGQNVEAKILLQKTDCEWKILRVPDDALEEVMAQGFEEREARLALRATNHQPSMAVRHIIDMRKQREELDKAEAERGRRRRKHGKTSDGSWVNLGYLDTLIKMGYPEPLAGKALRHSNNDISAAIEAITESPELLVGEDTDESISKEAIEAVVSMGFDPQLAEPALRHCKGDVDKVLDLLTKHLPEEIADILKHEKDEDDERRRKARQRMEEDLGGEDDHLDVTLEEEGDYLIQYKKLMGLS